MPYSAINRLKELVDKSKNSKMNIVIIFLNNSFFFLAVAPEITIYKVKTVWETE